MPDDKKLEKAFEVAADNRKFEIDMFWKRTVVFWGFVAALFIGIATTAQKIPLMAFGLSVVSVVFSLTRLGKSPGSA
ncbi:hypothetical protein, partial [Ectothiorhodospira variabilis]|uniref:RipA family octameric membrane protein n=1 Tax=Ectothiorhodospira variabilis TaxID=505694 RepID=UPI001EFB1878